MANVSGEVAAPASADQVASLLRVAVMLVAPLSLGNFSPDISPLLATLQQAATLGLWMAIIAVSYLAPARHRLVAATDTYCVAAFYCIAVTSVIWSNYTSESMGKAAALLTTTFAAYRLTRHLTIDEIMSGVTVGLFAVAVASLLAVAFVPEIGVISTWMHNGQWSGVFESKQSLGIAGGLLLFLALQQFSPGRRYFPLIAGFAGALCVFGSGSRAGFAIAGAAAGCSWLLQRSPRFKVAMTMAPLLITALATVLIIYMLQSPVPYFEVFGGEYDITERSFIWHFALSYWPEHPLLGFGLNGFWTNEFTLDAFRRDHGWVLDNYHSGFIAILMETGIVGYAAFILTYFFSALRLNNLKTETVLSSREHALVLSMTALIFLVDVTETLFLRSTNLVASLLAIMLFASGSIRISRTSP
jgi:O-antigen ligase